MCRAAQQPGQAGRKGRGILLQHSSTEETDLSPTEKMLKTREECTFIAPHTWNNLGVLKRKSLFFFFSSEDAFFPLLSACKTQSPNHTVSFAINTVCKTASSRMLNQCFQSSDPSGITACIPRSLDVRSSAFSLSIPGWLRSKWDSPTLGACK